MNRNPKIVNYIVILLYLLLNDFYYLIDLSIYQVLGLFKLFDLTILVLVLIFIVSEKGKLAEIISDIITIRQINAIFIFLIVYYIYTVFVVETATSLEAFKAARLHIYIYITIILSYYFRDKKLQIYFWNLLKYFLVFHSVIFLVMLVTQNDFLIKASWYNAPIPRIYIPTYNNAIIIFLAYVIQYFTKYKGDFKLSFFYFGCSVLVIFSSLGRGLWVGVSVSIVIAIIMLLRNSTFKNVIKISSTLKYILVSILFLFIAFQFVNESKYGEIIINRLTEGEKDISMGEGTFSFRQYQFESWMNENYNLGLEYTGIGFPHSKSKIIASKKYVTGTEDSWGSESEIFQKILNFGYVGYGIWAILILLLIFRLIKSTRDLQLSFALIIGLTIISYLLMINFISGFSGQVGNLGFVAFFIAFYEGAYYNENKNIN